MNMLGLISYGCADVSVTKTGFLKTWEIQVKIHHRKRKSEDKMKCEMCGMTQTPGVLAVLVTHVETCQKVTDPRLVSVVWRDMMLVATMTPKKKEMKFPVSMKYHEPAPAPELLTPVITPPMVTMDQGPQV
jgi:hypothetical protein